MLPWLLHLAKLKYYVNVLSTFLQWLRDVLTCNIDHHQRPHSI
jgi:hypothetical protein